MLKVGVSGEARAFRSTSNIGGKLWSSEMVYLTKEGASLSSMAAVKEYMEKSPKYNFDSEDLNQLQGLPQGGRDNARGPENANPEVS